jgi:predicted permease
MALAERFRMSGQFAQDVRYAFRSLAHNRGFAAVAALTLAIGIGANTAMFSIVNAVLLRPLPYPDADRLVVIHEQHPEPVKRTRLAAENFLDLQRDARSFAALGGYVGTGFTVSGHGEPELIIGQMVSAELFDALGIRPLLGRTFRPDENEGGRDRVVVLSYALWQRKYGGDPAVIGRSITINTSPYAVIGVMPRGFEFPEKRYQLWAPFAFRNNPLGMVTRGARYLRVLGRLRNDANARQAAVELDTIGQRLARTYPADNENTTFRMTPLRDDMVDSVRGALVLLLAAVAFVLLIACANVTNLLLARASTREREIAVRMALGAGRARLLRQLLTESLVLYAIGAAAGVILAAWSLDLLVTVSPADIPRLDQAALDVRTLLFTVIVTLATGVAFGSAPALQSSRQAPVEHLKSATRSATAGRGAHRLRAAIVASEVALSLMLLVGAGLATRSLLQLYRVDTGMDLDRVLTFNVIAVENRYRDAAALRRFHRQLLDRIEGSPGIVDVGATTHLPLSGQDVENSYTPEGWKAASPSETAVGGLRGIDGNYFKALSIKIVAGRAFERTDVERSQPVVMVNEQFSRRYWPGQDAVGKRLKMGGPHSNDPWRVVIGVYEDLKHRGPGSETRPEVSFPYDQLDENFMTQWARGASIVIRSAGVPAAVLPVPREALRALDPTMPLVEPQPMSALLAENVAQPRFRSLLLLSFALLAGVLAVVGIYGVVAYVVEQRAHEISVRIALGAQRRDVFSLVLRQAMSPVAAGLVLGLGGAIGVGRLMSGLLFGVTATDPVTFILTPVTLATVAVLASLLPARRAIGLDPTNALRAE